MIEDNVNIDGKQVDVKFAESEEESYWTRQRDETEKALLQAERAVEINKYLLIYMQKKVDEVTAKLSKKEKA